MNKKNVYWNMIGTLVYSLATVVLAALVKRLAGIDEGGNFTIAFKLGQTFLTVGYFEVRLFQVTDQREIYGFSDYFSFRLLTCALMVIVCLAYLAVSRRTSQMSILILLLCFFKMSDALADVFEGDCQKRNRLDLAGKSLTVRTCVSVLAFWLALGITKNLILSCAILAFAAFLTVCFYNTALLLRCDGANLPHIKTDRLADLFKDCFLLAAGAFLWYYITNCVTFAVDSYATNTQNPDLNYIFGALFMPTSVINLCSVMIFKPLLTTLTAYYDSHRYGSFLRMVCALAIFLVILTVVCMLGGWLIGADILSAIYDVNLTAHRSELLWLLLGGGLNAAGILAYYCLVVMRQQKAIFVCYIIDFAFACTVPFYLVSRNGLMGACVSYNSVMLIQLVLFACIMLFKLAVNVREEKKI